MTTIDNATLFLASEFVENPEGVMEQHIKFNIEELKQEIIKEVTKEVLRKLRSELDKKLNKSDFQVARI